MFLYVNVPQVVLNMILNMFVAPSVKQTSRPLRSSYLEHVRVRARSQGSVSRHKLEPGEKSLKPRNSLTPLDRGTRSSTCHNALKRYGQVACHTHARAVYEHACTIPEAVQDVVRVAIELAPDFPVRTRTVRRRPIFSHGTFCDELWESYYILYRKGRPNS